MTDQMKKNLLQPGFMAAVIILALAAVGLNGATQYLKLHFKKLPVEIARPVKAIPPDLGMWKQVSLDEPLEADVETALAAHPPAAQTDPAEQHLGCRPAARRRLAGLAVEKHVVDPLSQRDVVRRHAAGQLVPQVHGDDAVLLDDLAALSADLQDALQVMAQPADLVGRPGDRSAQSLFVPGPVGQVDELMSHLIVSQRRRGADGVWSAGQVGDLLDRCAVLDAHILRMPRTARHKTARTPGPLSAPGRRAPVEAPRS